MFLRSMCQCVCSSNTGFSPYYPHLPPSFLSSFLMVTHPISNQTLFIHPAIILKPSTFPCMRLICSALTFYFHPPTHPFTSPLNDSSHLISVINLPLLFLHFSSLLSRSSFSLPPSHCPLGSPPFLPSSLSLSLSHSALCLARSGWAAPRWLRVCVHSGACRASPPPGLTTRFCLSPLNSAASPPLPPLS